MNRALREFLIRTYGDDYGLVLEKASMDERTLDELEQHCRSITDEEAEESGRREREGEEWKEGDE